MATINLGSIKFKWQGAYAGGTAYTVDDVVSYNGSSYICILASTGNLPTNATYWEQMSSAGTNGTDGTDLTTTLTTQGDLVYYNGSALARLGAGTSGQALITGGTGANPSWGDAGGGKILQVKQSVVTDRQSGSGGWNDITGLSVSITPSATSSKILVMGSLTAGATSQYTFARFMRDTTAIAIGDSNSSNSRVTVGNYYDIDEAQFRTFSNTFLDSPNTTSATTYKIQAFSDSNTYYINYGGSTDTSASRANGASTITVMEVGA